MGICVDSPPLSQTAGESYEKTNEHLTFTGKLIMHIVIYCPVLSSITFSPADLFNMDKAKESSFET